MVLLEWPDGEGWPDDQLDDEDRPSYEAVNEIVPAPDGQSLYVQSRYEEPGHSENPQEANDSYIHMTRPLDALYPWEEIVRGPRPIGRGGGGGDTR